MNEFFYLMVERAFPISNATVHDIFYGTRMGRMVADLFETRSAKIRWIRVIRVLFQPLLIFCRVLYFAI